MRVITRLVECTRWRGSGLSTAKDSDYCPNCKVKVMEGNCFCDWPESLDVVVEKEKAKLLLENRNGETTTEHFKDKIKSISFSKVKGGARR
jgi:hypothetical protein